MPLGLCLSTTTLYKALIIDGRCSEWRKSDETFNYTELFKLDKDYPHKVLADINCWDLLTILESDHNCSDELDALCFSPPQNEFTDENDP